MTGYSKGNNKPSQLLCYKRYYGIAKIPSNLLSHGWASILQTTLASVVSQELYVILPHTPCKHTSTTPLFSDDACESRTDPFMQPVSKYTDIN